MAGTSPRLRIRATKTLFEVLALQEFNLGALQFVVPQSKEFYADNNLIQHAVQTLQATPDTDELKHETYVAGWADIYARGLRVTKPWDRPRRKFTGKTATPRVERKLEMNSPILSDRKTAFSDDPDDIRTEVCMVTFFFDDIDDKVHSARMAAMLSEYGTSAFYRSIIVSRTPEIRSQVIDALRADTSQAVRVDIFTVADLSFNITTHCLGSILRFDETTRKMVAKPAQRLNLADIEKLSPAERNGPCIKVDNLLAKFYGLLPDDYLYALLMDPIESTEKRGNLVVQQRPNFYRAIAN